MLVLLSLQVVYLWRRLRRLLRRRVRLLRFVRLKKTVDPLVCTRAPVTVVRLPSRDIRRLYRLSVQLAAVQVRRLGLPALWYLHRPRPRGRTHRWMRGPNMIGGMVLLVLHRLRPARARLLYPFAAVKPGTYSLCRRD